MIRLAVGPDLPVLADLEHRAFGADAWSEPTLRAELAQPGRVLLVAERDGRPAGYIDVGVVSDVADLHRVLVAPTHQRQGIASALLDAGSAAALDGGAQRMLLEVADDNIAALALYRARGFEAIHRRRGYYTGGRDALVLQVDLAAPEVVHL